MRAEASINVVLSALPGTQSDGSATENATSSGDTLSQGTTGEDQVRTWLEWLGMRFDPFLPLDAAADSRLSHYLIHHEAFASVWGDWQSFVFAPPGGGKTALRVRVTEACYVGQDTNRPFPIPYVPPFLMWGHTSPSYEDHLAALARAGAMQLLLSLAYRPHWLFRLDELHLRTVRDALNWNLPGPLGSYLEPCRQSLSVTPLRERINPAFVIPDPPDAPTLVRFCDTLNVVPVPHSQRPSPPERWDGLVYLLLETFGFDSVYLLLDGLDGAVETATDSREATRTLSPILEVLPEWKLQRIFFKGFLPSNIRPLLRNQFPALLKDSGTSTVHWTPELLAELIRQRVYAASNGAFGSLDAIASPALRGIEMTLALVVAPLPREILVLTRRVLLEHVQRKGTKGKIEPEDLDAAIHWYEDNQAAIVTELFST